MVRSCQRKEEEEEEKPNKKGKKLEKKKKKPQLDPADHPQPLAHSAPVTQAPDWLTAASGIRLDWKKTWVGKGNGMPAA